MFMGARVRKSMQQATNSAHGVGKGVVGKWGQAYVHDVQLLPGWPPNSPDINLTENFGIFRKT